MLSNNYCFESAPWSDRALECDGAPFDCSTHHGPLGVVFLAGPIVVNVILVELSVVHIGIPDNLREKKHDG